MRSAATADKATSGESDLTGPSRSAQKGISWSADSLLRVVGASGWLLFAVQVFVILTWSLEAGRINLFQYDWHVYAAGGMDLLEHTLYRVPLFIDGLPMHVDQYNMPPLSALLSVPLLWLPTAYGGIAWQAVGAASLAAAAMILAPVLRLAPAWAWAGVGLGLAAIDRETWIGLLVGNLNYLMLLVVTAFVVAHARHAERRMGILLGLAVAIKLWPIALVPLLVRERRWTALLWAAGVACLQGAFFLVWLGPDVVPDMLGALSIDVRVPATVWVIWASALRYIFDWWPWWGSLAIAAGLLAIPATGRPGVGFGILAGLAVIPNLWSHYLPTVLLAVLLIAAAAIDHPLLRHLSVARDDGGSDHRPARVVMRDG